MEKAERVWAAVRRASSRARFSARKRDDRANCLSPFLFWLSRIIGKSKAYSAEIAENCRRVREGSKTKGQIFSALSADVLGVLSGQEPLLAGIPLILFGPSLQTRPPAAHVSAIRFVLGAKLPAERGLFIEDYEEVDAENNG